MIIFKLNCRLSSEFMLFMRWFDCSKTRRAVVVNPTVLVPLAFLLYSTSNVFSRGIVLIAIKSRQCCVVWLLNLKHFYICIYIHMYVCIYIRMHRYIHTGICMYSYERKLLYLIVFGIRINFDCLLKCYIHNFRSTFIIIY